MRYDCPNTESAASPNASRGRLLLVATTYALWAGLCHWGCTGEIPTLAAAHNTIQLTYTATEDDNGIGSGNDHGNGSRNNNGNIDYEFNHKDYVIEFEPMELSLGENHYPSSSVLSFMPNTEPTYSLMEDFIPDDQRQYPAVWQANSLNIKPKSEFSFAWPMTNIAINSHYGFRHHPIRKRYIFHKGVDFDGERGEAILTIGPGRVTFAGWSDPGCGYKVTIDHPANYRSVYCHLSAVLVESGMYINKGSMIGLVGSTGSSTGNHLHLEIHRQGHSFNPLRILRKGLVVDYETLPGRE